MKADKGIRLPSFGSCFNFSILGSSGNEKAMTVGKSETKNSDRNNMETKKDDVMIAGGMPEPPTFQTRYAISEKLSKGNYGVVYRAVHRETSVEYAVKVIRRGSISKGETDGDDLVEREISLLKACSDLQNVVNVIEYFKTPRYYYIVQNYAPVR